MDPPVPVRNGGKVTLGVVRLSCPCWSVYPDPRSREWSNYRDPRLLKVGEYRDPGQSMAQKTIRKENQIAKITGKGEVCEDIKDLNKGLYK